MANCEVIVKKSTASGSAVLANAWVYWRDGESLIVLRTEENGRLQKISYGGIRNHPEDYAEPFTPLVGAHVEVYFSRGSIPIPDSHLRKEGSIFTAWIVGSSSHRPSGASSTGAKSVKQEHINRFVLNRFATLELPDHFMQLDAPIELELWPLLWELPTAEYETAGIVQGAALWRNTSKGGRLTVAEFATAPVVPVANRPKERGLVIRGRIDSRATGVTVQLLDLTEQSISLKPSRASTASTSEITGTVQPAEGQSKSFEIQVFLTDAVAAFGLVQIALHSQGATPAFVETYLVQLCGLQVGLVDDHTADPNGQVRGAILGESDERIIIDFLSSPEPNLAALSDHTRARRMIAYRFANQSRPLESSGISNAIGPEVLQPQMPLWMIELQFVGISLRDFQELLSRRYYAALSGLLDPFSSPSWTIEARWTLTLGWYGPDSRGGSTAPYRYHLSVSDQQKLRVQHTTFGTFCDDTGHALPLRPDGEVPHALIPEPTRMGFPVANRRLPKVSVRADCSWGRQAGAKSKEALVIEIQPKIVDAQGAEILRGGDGHLQLDSVRINEKEVDGGVVASANGGRSIATSSIDPLVRVPTFRVRGLTPTPRADVETLIDVICEQYYSSHSAELQVGMLALNAWQMTARGIFHHESMVGGHYVHFEVRGAGRRHWQNNHFGYESDTPFFGPPHGYGLVQRDPPDNDDIVWSFVENIRRGVREMFEKAAASYRRFTHEPTAAAAFHALDGTRIQKAMLQRDTVRRYNGGIEFRFENHQWMLHTTTSPDHYQYVNDVLHTAIGPYPGPIPFNPIGADFGPGI